MSYGQSVDIKNHLEKCNLKILTLEHTDTIYIKILHFKAHLAKHHVCDSVVVYKQMCMLLQ